MYLREALEGSLCKVCLNNTSLTSSIESHIGKGVDKFSILSAIAKIQRTRIIHKTQLYNFNNKSKEIIISQSLGI
jgi:hypothetical protein